jgi:glycosyltransferase involved in cell wall biosynthesis
MKIGVLTVLDKLEPGGGENIAISIAIKLRDSDLYEPIVCATRYGGELEERLRKKQVKYIILQRHRLYEFHKFLPLQKIIREQNIKIIHCHKTGSNFWGSIIGKFNQIGAIIAHVHGRTYSWKNFRIEKFVGRMADKIVSVSEFEKQRLKKAGVSPSKIITVSNGIDCANFFVEPNLEMKNKLGIKADAPVVGICAGLRFEKNHETFLLAAKEVLREKGDTHFLIVGDGDRKRELKALAINLGIAEHCIFTGFIKKEISELLSIFDIGILCSKLEAMPLTLLEYMASSKPIVATRVGGVPEVVREGVNGFLVPSEDYRALADKITLLLSNKGLSKKMGQEGLSIVKHQFSESIMARKIEDLYTQTLSVISAQN